MRTTLRNTAAAVALALALGACDQGLTEVNENPNGPLDVPQENLLAHALSDAIDATFVTALSMDWTEVWVQHVAEIQYAEEDVYKYRTEGLDGIWNDFYSDPLMDWERMIQKAEASESPNPNHVGVAQIGQSWLYGVMTDLWGDIPYSQALVGEEGVQPAYDAQSDVYAGILATLESAQAQLTGGAERTLQSGDLLYGGNMDLWRRWANSLRLRWAMRMADVDPAAAQAGVQAALAAGVFESAAQQAVFEYTGTNPYWNPIYDNSRTRDDHRVSATLVDRLKALNDPRLPFYVAPVADANVRASGLVYDGMPNGREQHSIGLATKSKFGYHFFQPDAPYILQTYAEVLFLRAEAAARGWGGDAEALYEAAVAAALELYEGYDYVIPGATTDDDEVASFAVSQAEIDAYLAQPGVAWNAASWRQLIAEQKWLLLFQQGPEAYAEWRRHDFPVLTPGPDVYEPNIPVRFPYPPAEDSYNPENLAAAKSRQGMTGAGLFSALWWDVACGYCN